MKTKKKSLPNRRLLEWAMLMVTAGLVLAPLPGRAVGHWLVITNNPGALDQPGHMLLLSDGTVMVSQYSNTNWYHLIPDSQGHYVNGQWSAFNGMESPRLFFASDVLQDGRVFVAGGEYPQPATNSTAHNFGNTNAEVFNPQDNGGNGSWTYVNPPTSLFDPSKDGFLDACSVLLADGTVMIAPVDYEGTNSTLIYNPNNSSWRSSGSHLKSQDEATWIKLPDDSILSIDMYSGGIDYNTSERYIPSLDTWYAESNTPVSVDGTGFEMGAGFMLADGRAFFLCGSGNTLFYQPSGNTNAGAWQLGPNMPLLNTNQYPAQPLPLSTNNGVVTYNDYLQLTTEDAPAAMLPNGKILCELSRDAFHMPVWFYEFDPSLNQFVPAPSPTNTTPGSYYNILGDNSDSTSMLDLPDGTVLYNDSDNLYVYQPDSTPPVAGGKPVITSVSFNSDGTLHLTGTGFNGISQGASYGDDFQMDSNFPLVRFTDANGNVTYGRTYNWSSTSVQTGGKIVSTECAVPSNVYDGPETYSLQVVANGNASDPVTFYGPVWVDFNYTGIFQFGTFDLPYSTLAQGISAVAVGGTIAIKGNESSTETPTIIKAMTIVAVGGTATIGQ
jgi:hypothetical protein